MPYLKRHLSQLKLVVLEHCLSYKIQKYKLDGKLNTLENSRGTKT